MSDAPRTSWVWTSAVVGLLGLTLSAACAPRASRRQTDVMERQGQVGVSAIVLRAQVNELAERLTGRIEETADHILAASTDRVVRRNALAFKADGVPAVYIAAYRSDPLTAAVDVWCLAFQVVHYVEEGVGRELFGAEQPVALAAVQGMLAETDAAIRQIVARPEDFPPARRRWQEWARQHPIEHSLSSRTSVAGLTARLRSEERDAFVAVGAATYTLENVSERLNIYAALLPRQARWQAELLAMDTADGREMRDVVGDVHALGAAARSASAMLEGAPGLLAAAGSPVREVLASEREAVLAGVDDQRVATLAYVTDERRAVLAALREERIALAEFLHHERVEGLAEADAIKTRGVDSAVAGLKEVVDYMFWRVGALLGFLLVAATVLAVLAHRLTLGSRTA